MHVLFVKTRQFIRCMQVQKTQHEFDRFFYFQRTRRVFFHEFMVFCLHHLGIATPAIAGQEIYPVSISIDWQQGMVKVKQGESLRHSQIDVFFRNVWIEGRILTRER
ncbi:hypothetical protein TKWG_08280 [Advenella kashmirensis WT001]|uniref:Uncharacterized protein n=1 Tax=Advenella kashmirensis (strain DSM 17095 / LMG 22695 / WT001) TaxID=1036672 RepID=I3UAJ9_ADVKW|nr:hypothetical protein TKWG_08280 [Advenella kashmirensis WT001]